MRYALPLALICLAACHGGAPGSVAPNCDDHPAAKSFLTWNTAMGAKGMVPKASLRAPSVVEGLKATAFDVACLQEVWGDAEARSVKDGLGLDENQAFYSDTAGLRESGKDICTAEQMAGVAECAAERCAKEPATEEVSICVRKKCATPLLGLFGSPGGPACFNCLVAMAGKSVAEVRDTCRTDGASRIQGGASSAMIVARTGRLYDKEPMLLPSSGSNRTALFATLRIEQAHDAFEEIEIACTHISASAKVPPSHSGYVTWEEEKLAQVELITARLAERALRPDGRIAPSVLLGDFNSGPDTSVTVWDAISAAGFTCPTADPVKGGGCSSCSDNTAQAGGDVMIDHVCYLNPRSGSELIPTCTDRLFDQPAELKGYDGDSITIHASDHYAKRVLFDLVPSRLRR